MSTVIKTERLILRPWREEDLVPFVQLNADQRVMECFPAPLSQEETMQMMQRFQSKIEKNGWGLWAVEVPSIAPFIGFIGLNPVERETCPVPFAPAVEVGWRLAYDYWGKGFATEGALASLKFGFEDLQLPEIVSFTATQNLRSMAVMKKIGMHRDPLEDFDHPHVPEGHVLKKHVLYRLKREEWEKKSI